MSKAIKNPIRDQEHWCSSLHSFTRSGYKYSWWWSFNIQTLSLSQKDPIPSVLNDKIELSHWLQKSDSSNAHPVWYSDLWRLSCMHACRATQITPGWRIWWCLLSQKSTLFHSFALLRTWMCAQAGILPQSWTQTVFSINLGCWSFPWQEAV